MFKKLKEKIAEEVKPLKIPQFAQSVVSPSSSAVVDSPPDTSFSLDDELPEDSLGNEGFSVVDLHHPSLPVPLSSGRFSRQSSMSSLASDASAFLPIHDVSLGAFNMQDMESASEREDVLPQMNNLSKQELCNSYLKLYRHYQKYKGRAADLKNFCKELEKDNKKHKTVLLECQEKSLRRMAELKEQCALEQHAKAHLEEALRNDLEEKDHLIQTLQTKIKLLKDVHLSHSSAIIRAEEENLLRISGEKHENSMEELFLKGDSHIPQLEQQAYPVPEMEIKLGNVCEEGEILALRDRIESFNEQVMKNFTVDLQETSIKTQLQCLLDEISQCLTKKISPSSFGHKKERFTKNVIDKILLENESNDGNQIQENSETLLQNSSDIMGNSSIHLDSMTSLESNTGNLLDCSVDLISTDGTLEQMNKFSSQHMETRYDLKELESELTLSKEKFEKVTQELENSHQMMSEQNSTITTLQKKLNTLEIEVNGYRSKIMESNDTKEIELAESKKQLEEAQQQFIAAQHTIEENKLEIQETKQSLLKVQQEFDLVSSQNTEIASSLSALQMELTNTKGTCEQLTQNLEAADEIIKERESTINHLNNEMTEILKELEVVKAQKLERSEIITVLENELKETKLRDEQISEELSFKSKSNEEKESTIVALKMDVEKLHKELEILNSQNTDASKTVSTLLVEMKEVKQSFEETNKSLESAERCVKEKDDLIIKTNEELTLVKHELDAVSKEKADKNEMVLVLQNELSSTACRIEDMCLELQSAHKSIDLKDTDIAKMQENLVSVLQELDFISSQKVERSEVEEALQNELRLFKSMTEELNCKLEIANTLNGEMDDEITNLKQNLESVKKELDATSLIKDEKIQIVTKLQNDLTETKLQLEKINDDINNSHKLIEERDMTITAVNNNLEELKKNLELESTHKAKAIEITTVHEKELALMKRHLEEMTANFQSAEKLQEENDFAYVKIHEELSVLHKEFDSVTLEKNQAKEEVDELQKKIIDMSISFKKINEELQSSNKLLEEKELSIKNLTEEITRKHIELSDIHKEFDSAISERDQARKEIDDLQQKLLNMSSNFKELNEELQISRKLLEEKELNVTCLSEEVANLGNVMSKISDEKQETNDKLSSLKKELTDTKLQFEEISQELQSVYHVSNEKDLKITNIAEELSNAHKEVDIISLQKVEAYAMIKDLNDELMEVKLNYENAKRELLSANQLVEEKDATISHLTTDITKMNKELDSMSAVSDEKCEVLSTLEEKLQDSKICFDKISDDMESAQRLLEEKDLCIAQIRGDLVTVQEELNETSTLHSQANENITKLEHELKNTKLHLEEIEKELECTRLQLRDKNVSPQENVNSVNEQGDQKNPYLPEKNSESVSDLQIQLMNSKLEVEKVTEELQSANRIIKERSAYIQKIEEELLETHKELNVLNDEHYKDSIKSSFESKLLENTISSDNAEYVSETDLYNRLIDSPNPIGKGEEHLSEDSDIFYKMNSRRKCGEDSSFKDKPVKTVKCSESEEQKKLKVQRLEICSVGSTSFIPEDEITNSQQNCNVELSDSSTNQGSCAKARGMPESEEPDDKTYHNSLANDSTCTSQVANVSEFSSGSEKNVNKVKVPSKNDHTASGGNDNNILKSSYKLVQNNVELSSEGVPGLQFGRNTAHQNVLETLQTMDQSKEHEIDKLQFSSVQTILEEIQKENKEYGSLLECHKNIINHLEGITKLHSEGVQPGGAEWLHKQLTLLSQKLYDTKEKQRIQMTSINRLVKHQQGVMKSDGSESDMAIEMQYLRNIVYQYMIGKETMLLAKVISAVMKFDQQQMDQVMQKEQQKQTLFGHLGLL